MTMTRRKEFIARIVISSTWNFSCKKIKKDEDLNWVALSPISTGKPVASGMIVVGEGGLEWVTEEREDEYSLWPWDSLEQ